MKNQLAEIIKFRSERLFNGAVNIEWFTNDSKKAQLASEAFIFHGPTYHGVNQEDVGDSHGHKLTDTANFTKTIVKRCFGIEEQPFTLAIAGYGTGKSHLGLTIASLINSPYSENAERILNAISSADKKISDDIRNIIQDGSKPSLVIALNGMRAFDLSAEITKQITSTLHRDGHDTQPLDDLRPRFSQAASLVALSNENVRTELLDFCNLISAEVIFEKLKEQDEILYSKVYEFFESKGMPIRVLAGESVRDVIDITVREYCGKGKPYRTILILFDEFGKYTEFATIRSQIAGIGVLQDLFEAVQANSTFVCFVGFIQFELNAYVNRIAPEYKNEIVRYITRYQSSDKLYLAVNLETLIANLIEKKKPELLNLRFDNTTSFSESKVLIKKMSRRFPYFNNYRAWSDQETFHSVIRKGCWPLSTYTTWLLFYLTTAGKYLQERSALALLGNTFQNFYKNEIDSTSNWSIHPIDLCSNEFINELISSEESGQQGSITHSYLSVMEKYSGKFSLNQINVLKAILIGSKLGLLNENRNDAIDALSGLSGIPADIIHQEIIPLHEDYNVIEWDETFKGFDILGDAVPRTQFISYLRQKVNNTYNENSKSTLFASKASKWKDLLDNQDCDFSEENKIYTQEWKYVSVYTNLDYLAQNIMVATDKWIKAVEIDQSRGTIIYCYSEQSRTEDEIKNFANKALKEVAKSAGVYALPIIILMLHDVEGIFGQFLAEDSILEGISGVDKARFGNLIEAHKEKLDKSIRETIDGLKKKRIIVTSFNNIEENRRLSQIGKLIFSEIYKNPISFPFDGFSTSNGNAADSCFELTTDLLYGRLNFDLITAKPVKVQNRAVSVLKDEWGIFNINGSISRRPNHQVIKVLIEKWDEKMERDNKISIDSLIQELCLPPYGANLASAGLILGVFIAPRHKELIIMKENTQTNINQWIHEGIFKGKFINPVRLRDVELVKLGEASSEWETLLDEWEHCESYLSQIGYFENSKKLKQTIPIPPDFIYREEMLVKLSNFAKTKIDIAAKVQEEAWNKIDRGYRYAIKDCNLISWGASMLKNLIDQMINEGPLWTRGQISGIEKYFVTARQYTIDCFEEWLKNQSPRSAMPDDVGDFKRFMTRTIGGNLKNINLEDLFNKLEEYTYHTVKRTELIIEMRQLKSNINSWLNEHQNVLKTKKIALARILISTGGEFLAHIENLNQKGVKMPDLEKLQDDLLNFIKQLENIEKQLFDRASALWASSITSAEEIDIIVSEIESLITSFEGQIKDLEDLFSMKKALRLFKDCNESITDTSNTWEQFNELESLLTNKCEMELSEEEVPWDYDVVIRNLILRESANRSGKSKTWMDTIIRNEIKISNMNAGEANQLLNQILAPPLFITMEHNDNLVIINKKLNTRLSDLSIEWLIAKFKELPLEKREEFIRIIKNLMNDV